MPNAALLTHITADIVTAYLRTHPVRAPELPEIITAVHAALVSAATPPQPVSAHPAPVPAVPIRKSVTTDFLISLETGKKLRSLRRHLTALGMTPDQYRAKWGLPPDYPMVAASYGARRSAIARVYGFGQKPEAVAPLLDSTALTAADAEQAPPTLAPIADEVQPAIAMAAELDTPAPVGAAVVIPQPKRARKPRTAPDRR